MRRDRPLVELLYGFGVAAVALAFALYAVAFVAQTVPVSSVGPLTTLAQLFFAIATLCGLLAAWLSYREDDRL